MGEKSSQCESEDFTLSRLLLGNLADNLIPGVLLYHIYIDTTRTLPTFLPAVQHCSVPRGNLSRKEPGTIAEASLLKAPRHLKDSPDCL